MATPPLALEALADPSRRSIVELLAEGSQSVRDLLEHFDFSQPALSKHLRVLREAGLVSFTKEGRVHRYELRGEVLRDAGAWLLELYAFWNTRLDALSDVLDELGDQECAS